MGCCFDKAQQNQQLNKYQPPSQISTQCDSFKSRYTLKVNQVKRLETLIISSGMLPSIGEVQNPDTYDRLFVLSIKRGQLQEIIDFVISRKSIEQSFQVEFWPYNVETEGEFALWKLFKFLRRKQYKEFQTYFTGETIDYLYKMLSINLSQKQFSNKSWTILTLTIASKYLQFCSNPCVYCKPCLKRTLKLLVQSVATEKENLIKFLIQIVRTNTDSVDTLLSIKNPQYGEFLIKECYNFSECLRPYRALKLIHAIYYHQQEINRKIFARFDRSKLYGLLTQDLANQLMQGEWCQRKVVMKIDKLRTQLIQKVKLCSPTNSNKVYIQIDELDFAMSQPWYELIDGLKSEEDLETTHTYRNLSLITRESSLTAMAISKQLENSHIKWDIYKRQQVQIVHYLVNNGMSRFQDVREYSISLLLDIFTLTRNSKLIRQMIQEGGIDVICFNISSEKQELKLMLLKILKLLVRASSNALKYFTLYQIQTLITEIQHFAPEKTQYKYMNTLKLLLMSARAPQADAAKILKEKLLGKVQYFISDFEDVNKSEAKNEIQKLQRLSDEIRNFEQFQQIII